MFSLGDLPPQDAVANSAVLGELVAEVVAAAAAATEQGLNPLQTVVVDPHPATSTVGASIGCATASPRP